VVGRGSRPPPPALRNGNGVESIAVGRGLVVTV
jgi:hypothetical protein